MTDSTTSFTPRPWTNDNGLVTGRTIGIDGKDMGPSFDIFDSDWSPHESVDDEWKANAHLIAAAPDLYVALAEGDRLSLVIESAVRNADPGNHDFIMAWIKQTRQALAKARGE